MCGSDHTKVAVTGNPVLGGMAHAEIQVTGGYAYDVIEGQTGYANGNAKLEGRSNGANKSEAFSVDLTPPAGQTSASFATGLRSISESYKNTENYSFPVPFGSGRLIGGGFNSNSYVSGLLLESYGTVQTNVPQAASRNGFRLPGWSNPLRFRNQ